MCNLYHVVQRFPSNVPSLPARTRNVSWPVRTALILGALFFAVQILVPFRHLAYPGNVRWTEEGYLFSWRVLVTEKTGLVKYRVSSSEYQGGAARLPGGIFDTLAG